MRAGEIIYIKAAPEITGTVCCIRDGCFTVSYPPSHGARHGQRHTYRLDQAHRFGPLRERGRIRVAADRTHEEQE